MSFSFFRALKFALQDFWRNIWLSIATITVLILALISVNVLVSLNAISEQIIDSVEEKVDVSIFFKEEVNRAQVDNFRQKLQNLSEVKEVVYINKDQALEKFKEDYKDEPKIIEAINEVEKNPLMDSVVIKAKNIEDYNKILTFLQLEENKQLIKYQKYEDHKKIIEGVKSASNKAQNVTMGLAGIFAIIAILIVFNAIRVTIYTHREEIAVMKLVGASNSFIRLPFLLESIIYSLFALGLTILLLFGIFSALGPYLAEFLDAYHFNLIDYYLNNFVQIFGLQLAAVILLNIFSSGIAISRYLRV